MGTSSLSTVNQLFKEYYSDILENFFSPWLIKKNKLYYKINPIPENNNHIILILTY